MSDRQRARLDQPRELRSSLLPKAPEYDTEWFGRFAEATARYMGTARFIAWMSLIVTVWIIWNVVSPDDLTFDPFPFIFLTLMLSLQASYAAPLILLAQNRQEARDRIALEQDRAAAARAHADMEFLTREVASLRLAMGDVATRDFLRSELRDLLEELNDSDPAVAAAADKPRRRKTKQ